MRYFVRRLEKLGHKVTLVPIKPANQLLLINVFEGEGRSDAREAQEKGEAAMKISAVATKSNEFSKITNELSVWIWMIDPDIIAA